jgi:hypothetical protein
MDFYEIWHESEAVENYLLHFIFFQSTINKLIAISDEPFHVCSSTRAFYPHDYSADLIEIWHRESALDTGGRISDWFVSVQCKKPQTPTSHVFLSVVLTMVYYWVLAFVYRKVFYKIVKNRMLRKAGLLGKRHHPAVESNWVHSAHRPPIGLLYLPRVIMRMENLVEWWLKGETEVLGGNLPQCRFVHHKSHMTANPGRRGERLTAWAMSRPYHAVSLYVYPRDGHLIWLIFTYVSREPFHVPYYK